MRVATLCVLAAACALLADTVGAGEIHGRALLAGAPPPPKKVPVTIDQYVCGMDKDAEDLVVSPAREIKNVVVWLHNPPATAPSAATTAPVQMDQKSCVFTPRVLLVPADGTVEFLNNDRLLHNLHSRSTSNMSFNRTQPRGRTIAIKFAKNPEFIRIDCDLHSWMRGWVVVTDHPFYAVTDARGQFQFGSVPPGEYTLKTWHETLGETSRTITVGAGPATVTVELQPK
ncbi:MAG TPA: carboxypeptidase regulatory-like domain-containing protein [Methylomirabilota bacterium]|nr:carboxypeptidase regulatory-like domain-containing protein [Methylomirabilota bacterium]